MGPSPRPKSNSAGITWSRRETRRKPLQLRRKFPGRASVRLKSGPFSHFPERDVDFPGLGRRFHERNLHSRQDSRRKYMNSNTSSAAVLAANQQLSESEREQAHLYLQQTRNGITGAIKGLYTARSEAHTSE